MLSQTACPAGKAVLGEASQIGIRGRGGSGSSEYAWVGSADCGDGRGSQGEVG